MKAKIMGGIAALLAAGTAGAEVAPAPGFGKLTLKAGETLKAAIGGRPTHTFACVAPGTPQAAYEQGKGLMGLCK